MPLIAAEPRRDDHDQLDIGPDLLRVPRAGGLYMNSSVQAIASDAIALMIEAIRSSGNR